MHVHTVSGGIGSWLAAKVDMAANPAEVHRFVFADTLYEDADCYRFLLEGACRLLGRDSSWVPRADEFPDYRVPAEVPLADYAGNPEWRAFLADLRLSAFYMLPELTWIVNGRDPWEIFRDEKVLGNSRIDPCSKNLKRRLLDAWQAANCDRGRDVFTVGIDGHEAHRFTTLHKRKAEDGWTYTAPLIGAFEGEVHWAGASARYVLDADMEVPRLYGLGYLHNNCGGFCIKAGHAHWLNRLRNQPERFAYDAMMERKTIEYLGNKPYTMLTDRRGDNIKKPLSLYEFFERYKDQPGVVLEMLPGESGCGCMVEY